MEHVNDIFSTLLSYQELLNLSERLIPVCEPVEGLSPLLDAVKTDLNMFRNIQDKSRSSKFTALLQELDAKRDNLFMAFKYYVSAWQRRSDLAEQSAAAQRLMDLIIKRGSTLYATGYSNESAQLSSLFQDLSNPATAANLAVIQAETWLTALKTAQTGFETAYQEKITAESDADMTGLKDGFRNLFASLQTMLQFVDILARSENDTVRIAVRKINEIIEDVMAIARARQTREDTPPAAVE